MVVSKGALEVDDPTLVAGVKKSEEGTKKVKFNATDEPYKCKSDILFASCLTLLTFLL